MTTVHVEVEAKFEVDEGFEVPSLVELFADARDAADGPWSEDEVDHHLAATYYDTADLALAGAGLTLRRRTGGEDAGWHLKVPMTDGSRSEVRLDLGDEGEAVPERLVAMTWATTLGRPLVPVARIETHRTVRHLVDATGRVLVELADDRVTARRVHPSEGPGEAVGAAQTWREVEVEVVDGPRGILADASPALSEHGFRPAAASSKVGRVLGAPSAGRPGGGAAEDAPGDLSPSSPAADVVLARIRTQVEQIRAQDLPVRLDAPGAVHAMRVATRRLRSALTTFRPLLRRPVTTPVAAELRWLAGVLGTARDAEVLRERVEAAVADGTDDARVRDASVDEVRGRLDESYRAAHDALLVELDDERYRALLRTLDGFLADPPVKARGARPAEDVLPGLAADAYDDVRSAMRSAHRLTAPEEHEEQEEALHDARKAAKRARYAGETVAVVLGDDAAAFAAAMEEVQGALGEHLDARVAAARLRELAGETTEPATAFTYGRLHAFEEIRAERSAADAEAVWHRASGKRLRRWMR